MEIKEKVVHHLRKYLSDDQFGLTMPDPDHPGRSRTVPAVDSSRVSVEVTTYNSKVYYVAGEVLSPGRIPSTGNDTVLDAINYAGGLLPNADPQNIRLVRPPAPGATKRVCSRRREHTRR